jgi:WXG100 family type VII secretion target
MDLRGVKMDYVAVKHCADRIKTERDVTVNELIARLRGINNELAASWDNTAQDAFENTFGNWLSQLENYTNTLTSVHAYLTTMVDAYIELENQARTAAENAASRQG